MSHPSTHVRPPGLPDPIGFSYGIMPPPGRLLFLAGQIGADASGHITAPGDLVRQADVALENLLIVVTEAGGAPHDVAKLVIYVTDVAAYRTARESLGAVWRSHFGRYYPAMTLVEVAGLFEPDAMVEVEGVAVIPGGGGGGLDVSR